MKLFRDAIYDDEQSTDWTSILVSLIQFNCCYGLQIQIASKNRDGWINAQPNCEFVNIISWPTTDAELIHSF